MFDLQKSPGQWFLTYAVGPERRLLNIGMMIVVAALITAGEIKKGTPGRTIGISLVVLAAVVAYWMLTDANTETVFDLERRVVRVRSRRPFFGRERVASFDEAVLDVEVEHSKTSSLWVPKLRIPGGSVLLGRETRGRNSTIRDRVEEIRAATGLRGTTAPE